MIEEVKALTKLISSMVAHHVWSPEQMLDHLSQHTAHGSANHLVESVFRCQRKELQQGCKKATSA